MSASFVLALDTIPPVNPSLVINDGATRTGRREVRVRLQTDDYESGARDVATVKIWGDVDPAGDMAMQTTEEDSSWVMFTAEMVVLLSPGNGRKALSARLRDDVGNETLPVVDFIDLDESLPIVEVVTGIDRGRISLVETFDAATFVWQATQPFVAYQVRVVPTHGSPVGAGMPLGADAGSVNVQGSDGLGFPANTPVATVVRGGDLAAASPGNTTKIVKVFVQRADGTWSS